MDKQHLNYLNALNKGELVNIISSLEREISDLHDKLKETSVEVANNSVSDSEYAVIKALRDMMSDQAFAAIEVHNNDYHL